MRTTDANVEMMVGLARILNKHAIPIHPLAYGYPPPGVCHRRRPGGGRDAEEPRSDRRG